MEDALVESKTHKDNRKFIGTVCSVIGIVLNIMLFAGKYFAGWISGSIAITADAFNNLSDAGSSFITLLGFWFAGKKPDKEHPFGHGRFEYLSGFVVSMAIMFMAFELAKSSISKIINPEKIETGFVAIMVLVASILVKIIMAVYNIIVGKKIDSTAMKATAVDSFSDAIATLFVLISMIIYNITDANIDGYSGLIVSLFIAYAGINAAKETMGPLLGQVPDEEFIKKIEDIVLSYDQILGVHDLVVHDYGPGRVMISLHAEVSGDGNLFVLHDVIDCAEKELNEKLSCESIIHMDPVADKDEDCKEMKKRVLQAVQTINEIMTIHDFRMVRTESTIKLIFDVVVPYSIKESDESMRREIDKKVKEIDDRIVTIVTIDKSAVK